MAATPIVYGNTALALKSAPINPAWVIEGEPTARNAMLSRSHDLTACTLVWDCTPGKFMWRYNTDETIHVLEGAIVLDDGVAPPRRLGPGDVVFFPAGAVVHWTVETHVRKLAFFRRTLPKPIAAVARAAQKAKGMLRSRRPSENPAAESPRSTTLPPVLAQQAERSAV